ncbi:hypothetical protein [Telluribacter sp. SYSU D00476]|uniref:hypothetical protein n=1 Tax=Telluribacter sp. SYSU D00476 TaxID=2811430 RepID=UPI001FF22FC8|nr:hypothetical protein [Telluribacter sp. SYSU D00476]
MLIHHLVSAQSFSTTGNWVVSVPASTITEAGNNYTQGITSATDQTLMSLLPGTNNGQNRNGIWEVYISKEDSDWDSRLIISARRTGTGTPLANNNTITGGTAYTTTSATPSAFFSGRGGYSNIPIQYQVSGLSVVIPVKAYTTNITYTFLN